MMQIGFILYPDPTPCPFDMSKEASKMRSDLNEKLYKLQEDLQRADCDIPATVREISIILEKLRCL